MGGTAQRLNLDFESLPPKALIPAFAGAVVAN